MSSNPSGIRYIQQNEVCKKPNVWKLNNTFLNIMKINKSENGNTSYQNLKDALTQY